MICRPIVLSCSVLLLVSIILVIDFVSLVLLAALIARVGSERARNAHHIGHASNDTDDAGEMLAVAYTQLECQYDRIAAMLFDGDPVNVGFKIGDRRSDRGQHAGAIDDIHPDFRAEEA